MLNGAAVASWSCGKIRRIRPNDCSRRSGFINGFCARNCRPRMDVLSRSFIRAFGTGKQVPIFEERYCALEMTLRWKGISKLICGRLGGAITAMRPIRISTMCGCMSSGIGTSRERSRRLCSRICLMHPSVSWPRGWEVIGETIFPKVYEDIAVRRYERLGLSDASSCFNKRVWSVSKARRPSSGREHASTGRSRRFGRDSFGLSGTRIMFGRCTGLGNFAIGLRSQKPSCWKRKRVSWEWRGFYRRRWHVAKRPSPATCANSGIVGGANGPLSTIVFCREQPGALTTCVRRTTRSGALRWQRIGWLIRRCPRESSAGAQKKSPQRNCSIHW